VTCICEVQHLLEPYVTCYLSGVVNMIPYNCVCVRSRTSVPCIAPVTRKSDVHRRAAQKPQMCFPAISTPHHRSRTTCQSTSLPLTPLTALGPLDGRYAEKVHSLTLLLHSDVPARCQQACSQVCKHACCVTLLNCALQRVQGAYAVTRQLYRPAVVSCAASLNQQVSFARTVGFCILDAISVVEYMLSEASLRIMLSVAPEHCMFLDPLKAA
jgi:hypothetical protein